MQDGVAFCGEPWKYIWTEDQKKELDTVMRQLFQEQKPLEPFLSEVLFNNIQDLYA